MAEDVIYRCARCAEHLAGDAEAPAVLVARDARGPVGFRIVRHRAAGNGERHELEPLGVLRGRWFVRLWCEGCGSALTPVRAARLGRLYQQARRGRRREIYVS